MMLDARWSYCVAYAGRKKVCAIGHPNNWVGLFVMPYSMRTKWMNAKVVWIDSWVNCYVSVWEMETRQADTRGRKKLSGRRLDRRTGEPDVTILHM